MGSETPASAVLIASAVEHAAAPQRGQHADGHPADQPEDRRAERERRGDGMRSISRAVTGWLLRKEYPKQGGGHLTVSGP